MLRKGDEPIPGYRLVRFLGRGQYGEVWEAVGPGRTRLALKFIDVSGKHGRKELHGVQRVKEIRHPHLMPITAMWLLDEDGRPMADESFEAMAESHDPERPLRATMVIEPAKPNLLVVAMGYCDKNLADRLNDVNNNLPEEQWRGLPLEELFGHMLEAAKAVDFLNSEIHDLGDGKVSIQHCDIKPPNIMLVGGAVQVCDFGLARMLGDNMRSTATGMIGSPAYMAPECVQRRPSFASDQYSLAITYYELRTGHLPFRDLSYAAVLDAHRAGALDFSRVGKHEGDVLQQATSLDPAERYNTCVEMFLALQQAISLESSDLPQAVADAARLGAIQNARDSSTRSSPRRAAKDTARPGGTARDSDVPPSRRHRRRRTLLKFGVVLCLLVGLASVLAVPSIRQRLLALLPKSQGENAKTPEELQSPQTGTVTDLTALIAQAEQKLQVGELDAADEQFKTIVPLVAAADPKTRDGWQQSVALGQIRVAARRPTPNWQEVLAAVQSFRSSAGTWADGIAAKVHALELVSRASLGEMPIAERLDGLLVLSELRADLSDDVDLDMWESREVERVQNATFAEVKALPDPAAELLDAVRKLAGDGFQVELLLAKAHQLYQAGKYAECRTSLVEARKLDTSKLAEDRINEIVLLAALADPQFSISKGLAGFTQVAVRAHDPLALTAALLARVRQEPQAAISAVAQFETLYRSLAEELRPPLAKAYAELIELSVAARLGQPTAFNAQLLADCERARAFDSNRPLVNLAFVECKLCLDAKSGSQEEGEAKEVVQLAQAALDAPVAEEYLGYGQYVLAVARHGSGTHVGFDAADLALASLAQPNLLWNTPARLQRATAILAAAAQRTSLPTDADLAEETKPDDEFDRAYRYLSVARRLESTLPVEGQAAFVRAAFYRTERTEEDVTAVASVVDELALSGDTLAKLQQNGVAGQVLLCGAQAHQLRYQQSSNDEDLGQAVRLFGLTIEQVFDARRKNRVPLLSDRALYERIMKPAYELASQHLTKLRQAKSPPLEFAARIVAARARLIHRAISVERLLRAESAKVVPEQLVYDAYQLAAELDPRAEYFIGQGDAIAELPDRIERLTELQALSARAKQLDPQEPGAFNLAGVAAITASRGNPDPQQRKQLVESAITEFEQAIRLSGDDDDNRPIYYEGLSAARLESAFYCENPADKRQHLEEAIKAAETASTFADRSRPENAYEALGNALEDQAYYLCQSDTYGPAIAAFVNAMGVAKEEGRHGAKSLLAAGRCRLRQVQSGSLRESEREPALESAAGELTEAIAAWKRGAQKTDAAQRAAEAMYWLSEVQRMQALALFARDKASARVAELLLVADQLREQCVKQARAAKSHSWPDFHAGWTRLAIERSQLVKERESKFMLLAEADTRANQLLAESQSADAKMQVRRSTLDAVTMCLVESNLERARYLLSRPLSEWTAASAEAEQFARLARESARGITSPAVAVPETIEALTLVGHVHIRNSFNPQLTASVKQQVLTKAEAAYGEAIRAADGLSSDADPVAQICRATVSTDEARVQRTARARLGYVQARVDRADGTLDSATKTALKALLQPIQASYLSEPLFEQVRQLLANLENS